MDAAVLADHRMWNGGAVIRDDQRSFFVVVAIGRSGQILVLEAKAQAMIIGILILAGGLHLNGVGIETDSFSGKLNDFKPILSLSYVGANSMRFVPRKLNGIAHRLAQKGLSLHSESRWLFSPSNFIHDVFLIDS